MQCTYLIFRYAVVQSLLKTFLLIFYHVCILIFINVSGSSGAPHRGQPPPARARAGAERRLHRPRRHQRLVLPALAARYDIYSFISNGEEIQVILWQHNRVCISGSDQLHYLGEKLAIEPTN